MEKDKETEKVSAEQRSRKIFAMFPDLNQMTEVFLASEINNAIEQAEREARRLEREDLKLLSETLCHVAQLLDGWHTDVAWTEWDESVRKAVSEQMRKVEDWRTASGKDS